MAYLQTRKTNVLKQTAISFTDEIMQFILNGGKFSETDFIRFTGFGGTSSNPYKFNADRGRAEFNKAKQRQYISPDGAAFDQFVLSWNNEFDNDNIEESDAVNIISDILSNYTREQMIKALETTQGANSEESYPAAWDQHYNTGLPPLPEDIFYLQYNEKSFVIHGRTFYMKDKLKLAGGRFNPFLTHPETKDALKGWIFPLTKKNLVFEKLTA